MRKCKCCSNDCECEYRKETFDEFVEDSKLSLVLGLSIPVVGTLAGLLILLLYFPCRKRVRRVK